jgi:hypothetical protein
VVSVMVPVHPLASKLVSMHRSVTESFRENPSDDLILHELVPDEIPP